MLACMAQPPRLDISGIPQHVVHRGNNRLPCFLDDEDRQRYLQCLRQALLRFDCRLHACVLMSSNHVHLSLTPSTNRDGGSQVVCSPDSSRLGRHGRRKLKTNNEEG
jgi:REP element-mobilizing transposase RayT